MKKYEHLQEYRLILETKSPVFIGNGEEYAKTEYIYDEKTNRVSFLDKNRFFQYLMDHNLVDKYESHVLSGRPNLQYFLKQVCKADSKQIQSLMASEADASDGLDPDHSLKNIAAFVKNAEGELYIPGSALKGCLRTVLLTDLILRDEKRNRERLPEEKRMNELESRYLHTLHLAKKTNGEIDIPNAVNSIMRGISISDSEPINRKHAALSRKLDLHTDGHINELNVVRQCIAPQTMISFRLTLDQSILQNTITAAAIQDAVKRFDQFYYKTYVKKFPQEENFDEFKEAELFILLGGGSGYFDKNLVYPFYAADEKRAVREVSDMFRNQRMFKKHRHEKDVQLGISPRVQKLTEYDENYYAMGLCTVSIQ